MMKSLIDKLEDWTDIDFVQHHLGVLLGIIDESKGSFQKEYKWVYWTANPIGDMLRDMLMEMVEQGVLLHDEEDQRLKANPDFDVLKDYPNPSS